MILPLPFLPIPYKKIIKSLFWWVIVYKSAYPLLVSILIFLLIFLNLKDFIELLEHETISYKQGLFFTYSMCSCVMYLLIKSFNFLFFENKIFKYKKRLNNEWFKKFIEYEYKKRDKSIFIETPYIITIVLSVTAIFIAFSSMQLTLDIANSKDWVIDIEHTFNMLMLFWWWSWILMWTFIVTFILLKVQQLMRKDILEDIYYWEYIKS